MNLADLTWPQVDVLSRDLPVLIPVAALEQHGHHLPVFTDSLLLQEVLRRAASKLSPHEALFAPLLWLGNSHHHLEVPGTLSASPRVYLDLLHDLAENLLSSGFKRLIFINGHGGNTTPGKQVIFELRQKHRSKTDLLLLFTTYWDHASPPTNTPCGQTLIQKELGHACEWETSMIQRLLPDSVGPVAQLEDVPFDYGFEPAYRGWITQERTRKGHIGFPRHASPEKGEHLLECFSEGVIQFIRRVAAWDGHSWLESR